MKLLLIGATGMVGSRIRDEAVSRGHSVIAASRHPEKVPAGDLIEAVALDATDADAITALAADADVIVSATSPRGGGDPIEEAVTFGKAVMAAAAETGKRLFVVGGAGSLTLPDGSPVAETLPDLYRGEALGMREVRDLLAASDLNWTFFCPPGMISPGERTGKFRLGTTKLMFDDKGESAISAEDYAYAVLDELEKPAHERMQMTIAY